MDELKAYKGDVAIPVYGTIADAEVYLKSEADKVIAEKDAFIKTLGEGQADLAREIEQLKQKLEDVKAPHYAEMVDAGMRERRLRRALYKACANWADYESCLLDYIGCVIHAKKWERMYNKCRNKAEEYK